MVAFVWSAVWFAKAIQTTTLSAGNTRHDSRLQQLCKFEPVVITEIVHIHIRDVCDWMYWVFIKMHITHVQATSEYTIHVFQMQTLRCMLKLIIMATQLRLSCKISCHTVTTILTRVGVFQFQKILCNLGSPKIVSCGNVMLVFNSWTLSADNACITAKLYQHYWLTLLNSPYSRIFCPDVWIPV